jgi:hypothetical protein
VQQSQQNVKILRSLQRAKLAQLACAPERTSHVGAVEIFAQIHERKESAKNPGFQIVGKRQATGSYAGEALAMFSDKFHDFSRNCFPPTK